MRQRAPFILQLISGLYQTGVIDADCKKEFTCLLTTAIKENDNTSLLKAVRRKMLVYDNLNELLIAVQN